MVKKKLIGAAAAATAAGVVAALKKIREGAAKDTYHVVPHERGWALQVEGAERATGIHDTKKAAVASGRAIAGRKRGTLVIHRQDGTIQRSHSYAD